MPTVYGFFPVNPISLNLASNAAWYTTVEFGNVIINNYTYLDWHVQPTLVYSNLYAALMESRHCSGPMFSSNTPIGYGNCSTRPYIGWNYTDICVTAGNYVANSSVLNYTTCQAMVNASLVANAAPAQLPQILPNLTVPLTCADSALPSSYTMCNMFSSWLGFNQSACMIYFASNMFLCSIYYDPYYAYSVALGYGLVESYQQINNNVLWTIATNYSTSTGVSYRMFESTTQLLLAVPILMSNNVSYYGCYCYCLTNMCNTNIATCSSGLGFNCSVPTFITATTTNTTVSYSTTTTTTTTTSTTFNSSTTSTSNSNSNTTVGSLNYTSSTSSTQSQINTSLIVGVGLAGVFFFVVVSGLIIFKTVRYCKKMPSTNKVQPEQVTPESNEPTPPNSKEQETPKKLHRPTVRTNKTVDLRNATLAEGFLQNT
ncbi:unnamed protein product [Rotaria socialis]|uniref:Uncharacterized protein n=1 Tax=Rotaria socialis TaxID=392032 RepID=A0A820RJ85_9BILA|nr:unnamed protein product [Rotaria socialis]CAF4438678.1 unnamed protein product [Rotaria socialis]